jgi:5-dehydro-2-deoxygluconokinase
MIKPVAKRIIPSGARAKIASSHADRALRAIVLGRIGYDLYSEQIGVALDRVRHFRAGLGGSSANIAVGLARLKWNVTMLGAVSDDAVGRFVVSELAAEVVDVDAVQFVRGRNTSLAINQVAPPFGVDQVFYRSLPADAALVWDRRMAAEFTRRKLGRDRPTLFVTNGTSLCSEVSRATTTRALQTARAVGMTTVLDVDYRASSWSSPAGAGSACRAVWPWVDILLANADEMRLLAPRAARAAGVEKRVVASALQQGVRIVVWKRGAAGSMAFTAEGQTALPAAPVKVVSTNGAGDGFAAGFLTAYGRGLGVTDCLRYGNAAAGWVVAHAGCAEAMPRPVDLARSLATVGSNPAAKDPKAPLAPSATRS